MGDDQLENDGDSSLIIQLSRDDSVAARTARFLSQILSLPQINRNENVRFLTSDCSLRVQQLIFERKRLSKSLYKSRQFCSKCQTLLLLGSNCSFPKRVSYQSKRLLSKKLQKLDRKRQTCESWRETKLEKRLRKRFDDMQNQKIIRCKICNEANRISLQSLISRESKKLHHKESVEVQNSSCIVPSAPSTLDPKKKPKKVGNAGLIIPNKEAASTPSRPLPMSSLDLLKSQLKPKPSTPAVSTPRSGLAAFLSSLGQN